MLVHCDAVVVGAGIAGSALASVLARAGLDVLLLERQNRYRDLVRGEFLMPWGVAEASRLDLDDALAEAGGHLLDSFVGYDDGAKAGEEPESERFSEYVEGVPGGLTFGHPAACAAFSAAAAHHGATVLRGVTHIDVVPGPRPSVTYRLDGVPREVSCRVVVGADGRSSRVRRQTGIHLEHAHETHMVAGLLVDGLDIDETRIVTGVGEDVYMLTFPQGGARARVYLCPSVRDKRRFAGAEGTARFLLASALKSIPDGDAWAEAVPAGPCRTYPGDDAWTDRPFTEGVVLVGDAGGHNNPIIGQGLSLALRDVRGLSEVLLNGNGWGLSAFEQYGSDRAERLRRVRFIAQLEATAYTDFSDDGRVLRRHVARRMDEDESLLSWPASIFVGPEAVPPEVFTADFRRRAFGSRR